MVGLLIFSETVLVKFLRVIQEIYHCSNHNVLHELSLVIIFFRFSHTSSVVINIKEKVSEPQNIIII